MMRAIISRLLEIDKNAAGWWRLMKLMGTVFPEVLLEIHAQIIYEWGIWREDMTWLPGWYKQVELYFIDRWRRTY